MVYKGTMDSGLFEAWFQQFLLKELKELSGNLIQDKVVMITGAGGSIGSELCRQIVKFNPKLLVMVDIYENNIYDIQNELKRFYPNAKLDVLIDTIRDENRMDSVFGKYRPEIVFHAAAHKHVPLMEHSSVSAVKNNV